MYIDGVRPLLDGKTGEPLWIDEAMARRETQRGHGPVHSLVNRVLEAENLRPVN